MKRYACNKCDYQGMKQRFLRKHIQSKHEGNSKTHITAKQVAKVACKQCGKEFSKQSILTSHIQVIHEGMRYACDKCNYQTNKKGCLRKHTQSKHEITTTKMELKYKRFPKLEVKASEILKNFYLHQSSIYSCESGIRMDNYDKVVMMDND